MIQIVRCPVAVFVHTRSGFPSPLKSPVAVIAHSGGMLAKDTTEPRAAPFISQIRRSPVAEFVQTRSDLPSELKSVSSSLTVRTAALLVAEPAELVATTV